MPYDSQGNFSRIHNWEDDRLNNIDIVTDHHDAEDDNFAEGLNIAFLRDGRIPMEGDLNMGAFKIKNVAKATYDDEAVNKEQLDEKEASIKEFINAFIPVGDVKISAAQEDHDVWMIMDGRELSRTEYADLYAVVGTTFGEGNKVTTFNIPDARGVFIRGFDNGRGMDDSGRTFGSYQEDRIQNITGTFSAVRTGMGDISSYDTPTGPFNRDSDFNARIQTGGNDAAGSNYSFDVSRAVRTGTETAPKNIALNYFIKVKEA